MAATCDTCGKSFDAARADARYCSGRCRTLAYRKRQGETAPARPRRPLPDAFRDAALDLDRITGRLQRLVADDRFKRNRSKLEGHRRALVRARDAIDAMLNDWPISSMRTPSASAGYVRSLPERIRERLSP